MMAEEAEEGPRGPESLGEVTDSASVPSETGTALTLQSEMRPEGLDRTLGPTDERSQQRVGVLAAPTGRGSRGQPHAGVRWLAGPLSAGGNSVESSIEPWTPGTSVPEIVAELPASAAWLPIQVPNAAALNPAHEERTVPRSRKRSSATIDRSIMISEWPESQGLESAGSRNQPEGSDRRHEVLATYNSLSCTGPFSAMLGSCGLAYLDVPGSSIWLTSRPLTAAFSRWWMSALFFFVAACLLRESALDVAEIIQSSGGLQIRYLRVDNVTVHEHLLQERADFQLPADQQLQLLAGGVYLGWHSLLLAGTCNTSLISDRSFEISCREPIHVHGFWLHVSRASRARYRWAGVQYSWCGSVRGDRCDIIHAAGWATQIPGSGQVLPASEWRIARSSSDYQGVFRVPVTGQPLSLRSYHSLVILAGYIIVSLGLLFVGGLSLAGKALAAKRAAILTLFLAGVFMFWLPLIDFATTQAAENLLLGCVLAGLRNNVKYGTDQIALCHNCGAVVQSVLVLGLQIARGLAFKGLALVFWREQNVLAGFFGFSLAMLLLQLGLKMVASILCSPSLLYVSALGCGFVVCQFFWMMRVRKNVEHVIQQDKDWYDRWWQAFCLEHNNRHAF